MTWLLAKLGLSLAGGKTLMPIAALLAAAAALVGLGLYAVHSLTAAGYDKAVRECQAATAKAQAETREQKTQNAEISREVIIKYTAEKAARHAALPAAIQEVTNNANQNPMPAACSLDPDGLRLWNRPISEYRASPEDALHRRSIADRRDQPVPADPATSGNGRFAEPPAQSGNIERPIRSAQERVHRARQASRAVPGKTLTANP